jgi:hypothetical protein
LVQRDNSRASSPPARERSDSQRGSLATRARKFAGDRHAADDRQAVERFEIGLPGEEVAIVAHVVEQHSVVLTAPQDAVTAIAELYVEHGDARQVEPVAQRVEASAPGGRAATAAIGRARQFGVAIVRAIRRSEAPFHEREVGFLHAAPERGPRAIAVHQPTIEMARAGALRAEGAFSRAETSSRQEVLDVDLL